MCSMAKRLTVKRMWEKQRKFGIILRDRGKEKERQGRWERMRERRKRKREGNVRMRRKERKWDTERRGRVSVMVNRMGRG